MYFRKSPKAPSALKILNGNVDTIPWEEANRIYTTAAKQAEAAAKADVLHVYTQQYNARREAALRRLGIDESEATYEGDLGIEAEFPSISKEELDAIRNKAGNAALEEQFIKPYAFKTFGPKVLDQLITRIKDHKLNKVGKPATVEGRDGKVIWDGPTISGIQYCRDNFDLGSETAMGIYRFLKMDSRSSYLDKLGSGENKRYCSLVPLILYAHKLYNNIPYSAWERETLSYVVHPSLANAMLTEVEKVDATRLLEIRHDGLEIMSGASAGGHRNPATTYGLYRTKNTEIGHYPQLVQIMLTQIWAAHPTNRTKYMVLDPMHWDEMPDPLIQQELIQSSAPLSREDIAKALEVQTDLGYE